MGIGSSDEYSKKHKVVSVISLNYSGILLSPFEFFSKENKEMTHIETSLSNIYKRLLKSFTDQFCENKQDNKFKWSLGKIDQKMQAQRYSPLYNKSAGVQNNKIIGEQKFKLLWQQTFKKNIKMINQKKQELKYTQSEMRQAMQFDLLCYKCILSYVYQKFFNQITDKQAETLDPKKYLSFMNKMFNKSFLNEEKKLQKTLHAMKRQNIDIVFAQQANQSLIKKLSEMDDYVYFTQKGSQSIIILKKQKFRNFYTLKGQDPLKNLPQIEKQLLWNNDTVVAFVDNLILISGHLSSKKDKNPKQVYDMMLSLKKLHSLYPMCHIIVGCDANSFVPTTFNDYCKNQNIQFKNDGSINKYQGSLGQIEKIKLSNGKQNNIWKSFKPKNFVIYPNNPDMFTTSKERTYLQPQVSKAQEVARVCRDHLIILMADDINVDRATVCTILDKHPDNVPNLPCQDHPYDHYVVKGFLTINVMTHFGKDTNDSCFS